jgi:putative transposase
MFRYGNGFNGISRGRFFKRRKVSEIIIYETLLKVGNQYAWLWIAIDSIDKVILDIHISFERTIPIAETFL